MARLHNHGGRSRSEGDALGRKKPFVFVWVPGRLEVPEVRLVVSMKLFANYFS